MVWCTQSPAWSSCSTPRPSLILPNLVLNHGFHIRISYIKLNNLHEMFIFDKGRRIKKTFSFNGRTTKVLVPTPILILFFSLEKKRCFFPFSWLLKKLIFCASSLRKSWKYVIGNAIIGNVIIDLRCTFFA